MVESKSVWRQPLGALAGKRRDLARSWRPMITGPTIDSLPWAGGVWAAGLGILYTVWRYCRGWSSVQLFGNG